MVSACEGGNLDVVKWLYLNGATLTETTDMVTPMWAACSRGHLVVAKWIYSVEMVDLSTVNVDGLTYMMAACSEGHLETAKWLYSVGASVHAVNYFEENAMTLACEFGDLSVAEWLYQRGLGVRAPNAIGQTPLLLACSGGNLKLVRWLFDHGAAPDLHTPDARGGTPVTRACIAGALDVAQWLHAQGAELDHAADTSFYAAENKHWGVIFWLHEKGARLIPNLLAYADPALACRMVLEGLASTNAHVDKWKVHYLRDRDAVRGLLSQRLKDNFEIFRVIYAVSLPVWCLVAEFTGVVRGRPLRNVREALAVLEDGDRTRQ
jgi:ankyrin repeat protein